MSVFNGRLVHSNKKLADWRRDISLAMIGQVGGEFTGPVYAYMVFVLPRPKTVRRPRPSVKPDLDKLVRAVLDAVESSGVIANDSQVCEIQAVKVYVRGDESPRLKLYLKEMDV